ncbi:hypothetical protein JOD54_005252 [Actinokineospora baliensis]|uniref:TetR family transcriptional regulator n=1 Tax=Actinokineospora baliensis TaxID=547056 RepID=UPI001EF95051|nr:TetR family transcriptional regulator [Actinokineospora baliensis]MBM7775048.1 hypothetical protein [Actinokineospora baliensis]
MADKPGAVWLREKTDRQTGAEGLTMRRLAQRLGVTSTALYWHVATKDDVQDLAVGQVLVPPAFGSPSSPGCWPTT